MAVLYTTIAGRADAEQTIEKSRFIAHITPVSSRDEAEAFIASIRKEYKDATHNVPAYVIGDRMQLQWGSDDGEPQGTSGAPIVQMLVKENITNVCVVVTRYFGGIKLGTGGLVRAYTSSAKMAVESAGIKQIKDFLEIELEIAYNLLGKLQNFEKEMPFEITGLVYAELIRVKLRFESEHKEKVEAMLTELTKGRYLSET